MGSLLYQWIDLIWLPVGWLAVPRHHRVKALILLVTCMLTMRTQIELLQSLELRTGFLPVLDAPLHTRGLIVYGVIFALFLLLAHYSPRTLPIVFFAACLSIFIFAFCVSTIVMIL